MPTTMRLRRDSNALLVLVLQLVHTEVAAVEPPEHEMEHAHAAYEGKVRATFGISGL